MSFLEAAEGVLGARTQNGESVVVSVDSIIVKGRRGDGWEARDAIGVTKYLWK